ncbi:hypothetical protein HCN44_003220 [Aphidius gifuensis]|uniref:2-(3-amino-3-carboxypropyl)histidine synthase subunit 2 n=1 Tax=Aphidius gifuensis TaxID=684658 RepID=A0A834XJS6_APHGI|nr:2-(3-amino-3-carboxypropyl)histidine synthase subunit 2 [Aphidius gifuensis]KAF7987458.1 hypothetical protein HCN44_003220 [Aphidius gifuensis]
MTPSNTINCQQLEDSINQDILSSTVNCDKYSYEKCVEWINARGLEKVCLQFPDSLLSESAKIAINIEELLKKNVYILGDTTCGSCCIDEVAANHIGADGVIHFGHACLNPTSRLPVFHILPKNNINIQAFIDKFQQFFTDNNEKILLFYSVYYANSIETIWNILKDKYPNLVLTTLNCKSNVDFVDTKNATSAIISGRSWILNDDTCLEDYHGVFIGDNDKTLASLAMSIPTKTWQYTVDDELKTFEVTKNPWLRRRRFLVEKLKDANTVGIVVATLGIKDYMQALSNIKNILKQKNKKSYVFSVGKPNPSKLANFPEVDAFVVIACPENDIFDSKDYYKPMLTPFEVELAFNNSRSFTTNYCLDFRQLLPGGFNYVEFKPTDDSDVSMLSNEIRNTNKITCTIDKMDTVACKADGTVAIGKSGANFLLNRSWQGLEQKLGENNIEIATKGRSGLPTSYDNEPVKNNNQLTDK